MNLLLILAVLTFAYFMWKKYNGRGWKYVLGFSLIILGVLFVEFTPDPISFGAYAMFNNIELSSINSTNIANNLWNFEIWSITVGAIMLFTGAYLLNWNWKKIWGKINIGKYNIALLIAVGTVLAVSLLDIWSANSGVFGNLLQYTNGNFGADWWPLFFKFVLVIFAIVPISYYFLVHKDKSEAVGIFGFSTILYFGGLSDVFYFVFQKLPLPSELPWLIGSPFISYISNLFGYSTVTSISLLTSVLISFVIAWGFAKIMKEYF